MRRNGLGAISVISQAERSNYLRQCWRNRHWKDGVGTLLLPLRMSLYGFRKRVLRPHRPTAAISPAANSAELAPEFSADIRPVFCERVSAHPSALDIELGELFAEVDAQLRGFYRLAGGRSLKLDIQLDAAKLESLEDAEDQHAYHRLYWALRYAVAASFGHQGAEKGLADELPQWLDGRWQDSAVAAWPYTLAERIASLAAILFWIDFSRNRRLASLIVPIKRQIWSDASRLSSTVEYGLGLHNHLLNDARGLFLASAALADCNRAAAWREQAFQIWDEYFPQLVLEDGSFAEQSSHYHLLLCRTALEYVLACRRSGRSLPAGFETRFSAMFHLANELLRPDGSLPRFGDNSPDRTGQDIWGLLSAAYFHGLLDQPPHHRAVAPLTIFYCGVAPELPPAEQPARSVLFPHGGFAILRSSNSAAELVAHSDTRATVGTHGDAGLGSYELWCDGRVLIREPGSFYSNSDSSSRLYQSAAAQNVTSLDGLAPAIAKHDARFLARWYSPAGGAWKSLPRASASAGVAAEFRCDAFRRLDPSIVLFRAWRFEAAGLLRFEERIEGASRVRFESRLCLGDAPWNVPAAPADLATPTPGAPAASAEPGHFHLVCESENGSSAEMTIAAPPGIAFDIQPCKFLPEYGVETKGRVLVLSGSRQLPFSWTIQWKFTPAAQTPQAAEVPQAARAASSVESAESAAQVARN